MENIRVLLIGAAAEETMKQVTSGRVAGVTSKGAFLRAADRIMFLTPAEYRSPFNLILQRTDHLFAALQPGDGFKIEKEALTFISRGFTLLTRDAEIWQPPLPAQRFFSIEDQKRRVARIIDRVRILDNDKGFLFLAGDLNLLKSESQRDIHKSALELVKSFKTGDKDLFLHCSIKLLGAGGGLTPSGDDFLAGLFLYHFRNAQAGEELPEYLSDWWAELTRLAFEKTTTISANRLEYTERGWSEELFLQLIDHLFNPRIPFGDDLVQHLVNFGHSSGVDTLMGIYYALDTLS